MTHRAVLPISLTILALLAPRASADDAAIAARLKDLGGKVTEAGGVVTTIAFSDCSKLTEAEFRDIGQLHGLKELILYGRCHGLNDAALASLAGLSELETLGTDGIQVSDEGLKQLAQLKSLRSAAFFHTSFGAKGFTGVGFGALAACPKLEKLTVAGISMGDDGFAAIATITQLKELRTWHTYQTAAAYEHIARLPNLRSLYLGQRLPHGPRHPPSLTDATIPVLVNIKTLESLTLTEAHFTPAALAGLKPLPHLKKLSFSECDLAPADVEQLRKDLPAASIDYKPLTEEQRKKFETYLKE
jgi:hypothetical protein